MGEIRIGEEQGKMGAVLMCRMVLRYEFEALPL